MLNTPIFIVSAPRSGTTLLSAMLGSHSRISCGPETNFFRILSKINPDDLCNPETWPGPAVDFICSISQTGYGGNPNKRVIDKYKISEDEVRSFLVNRPPSIPNILSSITEQYMISNGKSRWVEKTPDHVLYVGAIRRYFPDSPIIQILRDPRDVVISLINTPWGADTYLDAIFYWDKLIEAGKPIFAENKLAYTLHYECLVSSPIDELIKLCDFIGEEFEPGMLDTSATGKRLNSMNVSWKEKASQPIDKSRVNAWRTELPLGKNSLIEAFIGDDLREYNYSLQENFIGLGELFPSINATTNYEVEIERLASEGIRFWKLHPDERSIAVIFVGDPGNTAWLGQNRISRLFRALWVVFEIVDARRLRKRLYWVNDFHQERWGGYLANLIKLLLRPYQYPPVGN